MALCVKRTEEIDNRRVMLKVQLLSGVAQQDEREEEKGDTEQEVSDVAAFLAVYQHDAKEECGEHHHGEVYIVAQ